jgi:hypothetical protein
MYNALARKSPKNWVHSVTGTQIAVAAAAAVTTVSAAGRMRRARRPQKSRRDRLPVASTSRRISVVMRKPEIAKNASTPTKPPGTPFGHRCHATTSDTASARSAWISGRMPAPWATTSSERAVPARASLGVWPAAARVPFPAWPAVAEMPLRAPFAAARPLLGDAAWSPLRDGARASSSGMARASLCGTSRAGRSRRGCGVMTSIVHLMGHGKQG